MRSRRAWGAAVLAAVLATTVGIATQRVLQAPAPLRLLTGPQWAEQRGAASAGSAKLFVDDGSLPGAGGPYADMVQKSLEDLYRLTDPGGAVLAAPAGGWDYSWPRDAAFVAVAFAQTGHSQEAVRILRFFARVQLPGNGFAARYHADGQPVEDGRAAQADAPGWLLWAAGEVASESGSLGGATVERAPDPLIVRLVDRCTEAIIASTSDGRRLPRPTPDYWETPVPSVPLGEVAPMIAGLRGAARAYEIWGSSRRSAQAASAAARLRATLDASFGPSYRRYPRGGGWDAGVAFLMPPFAPEDSRVTAAWQTYQRKALRSAGGLAPGTQWEHQGESWTPETALVAYTAAAGGEVTVARERLDWLQRTRTRWGSFPEKVTWDGRPAGPAPLAWTAALVVLAVAELDAHDRRGSGPA